MEPKEKLQNFKKLASKEKSGWLKKAKHRSENKAWLDKSAGIAVRILSEIRKQKPVNGMSQKKLALEMGVTPQYINKVVKGKENLTIETISKIENVLGISLMEIPSSHLRTEHSYTKTDMTGIKKYKTKSVWSGKLKYSTKEMLVADCESSYKLTGTHG